MALEYVKKTQKYESVRIYDPNQKAIAVTHWFRGQPFVLFNNKRGIIIGKGIRPTFDQKGNEVSDYTWEDIVEHFKGMGFKIEHIDLEGKVKKEDSVSIAKKILGKENNDNKKK